MLLLLGGGCGGGGGGSPVSGTPAPARVDAPALPDDVLVQLFVPSSQALYRITEDGRYLVAAGGRDPVEQQPRSKRQRGARRVPEAGLERIRETLSTTDFFALPARVPAADCVPAGTVLPGSGRRVSPQPLVFSARSDQTVKVVEAEGDLRAPCTLGPLEPVYRALDEEALGDWMRE